MSELRTIPNIGACTEQDLILMGYTTIASLRGKSAEELYAEECRLRGCTLTAASCIFIVPWNTL